ncbi:toprim domain-containing protein [Eubacteriales bacterium OttesenSCG-928-G02]|nr:toprim domain-containing protein [Eubacteriales bacterium OttesenSCG-928-G02]
MPYLDPQIITEAKQMDLLTYLRNYDPNELVHVSGGEYTTKTHDSLRISDNGLWNWCSHGVGGRNALEYLIQVKGLPFINAVETIMGRAAAVPPTFMPKTQKTEKRLLLPQAAPNNQNATQYLKSRGLDERVIRFCIDTGRLYEGLYKTERGREFRQCVFVGFDIHEKSRYAAIRGIGTDYKGDANGSDKRYSFSLIAKEPNKILHIYESAIDALSHATMWVKSGDDFRDKNLLSLAGIYIPKSGKLPLALTQFLSDHPHIKDVHLHLDNDIPGRTAAKAICLALKDKYTVWDTPPVSGKDINESLCRKLGIYHNSSERRNDAR